MMKDKALEDLFLAQRPIVDDGDEFMERLARKLDAVEYLRQYEEANRRRYKYALVAAFVMGILVGGVMLVFVFSIPKDVPLIAFHATSGILFAIEQNSRIMVMSALFLFFCLGIVSIVTNVLDIMKMRTRIKTGV